MRKSRFSWRATRAPRHALVAPCQIVRLRDFRLVADRVVNFSTDGLLVSPAEAVLTGEQVLVSLRFPETDEWLDTTGVVARIVHGRRPGEWERRLGLELDDLDSTMRRMLERNLARTPPAPPRARAGRRALVQGRPLARLSAMLGMPFEGACA